MIEIATIVLPVFLVVFVGYIGSFSKIISDAQVDGLMRFTVYIAAPSLLFNAVSQLDLGESLDPALLITYYVPVIAMLLLGTFVALRVFKQRPGEAVASGFTATFANSLFLGLPIVSRAYDEQSIEAALAIVAVHAPICYLAGCLLMETMHREGSGFITALRKGFSSLSRNPLVIGVVAGVFWNVLMPPLPMVLADASDMLGRAALPVGMFAVGAALTRYSLVGDLRVTGFYVFLTLILRPLLVLLFAVAFGLSSDHLKSAVMMAAMPGGMNIYIFASMYKRSEALAANALLLGTALGIVTVSLWLALLG